MVPTRSRVEAWQQTADGLSAAARHWRTGAGNLERSAEIYVAQIDTPDGTEWFGLAAESALTAAHADRNEAYRRAEHVRGLADVADRGAGGLRWGRQLVMAAITEAEADGCTVAEDLSVADRHGRMRAVQEYRKRIAHWAVRLQTEDDRVAAQLAAGSAALVDGPHRTRPAGGPPPAGQPPPVPASGTGPADVYAWWASLPPADRARLLGERPRQLGNLNGIPAVVRGAANASALHDDITVVENAVRPFGVSLEELRSSRTRVLDDPGRYGLSSADVCRYRNAVRTDDGLRQDRGSGHDARPALLWAYNPMAFDGQGTAAIALGDPDTAANTTVIVPGTGSSVAQGWMADHDDAVNVFDHSVLTDPDRTTAVIAWMGYDAPDGLSDRRVTEPGLARRGGELLARDVNGLWTTHHGPAAHVTIVGHSYGATTVADAFAHSRMHASDAVLLGCPGTDLAHTAADFNLDGGRVYVGSASTDPVSWIGQTDGAPAEILKHRLRQSGVPLPVDAGLGRDPAGQGFGSIRFHAEVAGSEQLNRADHTRYYQPDGAALKSMTQIATGHPERLATDGLLAAGRRQPHLGMPPELHVPGLPPVGLPHLDTRIPGIPAYLDPERNR